MILVTPGSTSQTIMIQIMDDVGLPVTNLNAATFPITSYAIERAAAVPIPLVDLDDIDDPYTSGGVFEIANGRYRLDVPDDAFLNQTKVVIIGDDTDKHIICDTIMVGLPTDLITALVIAADALTAIANKVEFEILDETDSEKVLEAIVNKINAMTDLDALSIAAIAGGVLAAMEQTGTKLTEIHSKLPIGNLVDATAITDLQTTLNNMPTNTEFELRTLPTDQYALLANQVTVQEIEIYLASLHGEGSWESMTGIQMDEINILTIEQNKLTL